MFAHQMFLKVSSADFTRTAGNSMALPRLLITLTKLVAPWFLLASFFMLAFALGLWIVVFLPVFALGYFLFSLRSMRDGGPVLPTIIALGGIALLFQPEAPVWVSRFLATYGLALWCNRFHWWFAEWMMTHTESLNRLFQQKSRESNSSQTGAAEESSGVQEAEVVSITDA